MAKKIVILNGSPRLNGNTMQLIEAFKRGAEEKGHQVELFNLQRMDIHPCLGCLRGGKDPDSPCVQKDDMLKIYPHYKDADVLVLASPEYYWSISAQLKMAIDRIFAVTECDPNYATPHQNTILLMAAEGDTEDNFEPVRHYYHALTRHLGWDNLGEIFAGGVMAVGDIKGHPQLEKAYELGKSL
jgi:multimeric flavodoxin WrbA